MKRRGQQEFSPALPITATPANHPSLSDGATIVKVVMLEAVGTGINHAAGWPWWIGAQLPVAYLFWRLMHERAFYEGVVRAWNKRLEPEPRRSDAPTAEDVERFLKRMENPDGDAS